MDAARTPEDLKSRTKRFALSVVRLYSALPKTTVGQVIGRQMLRSGTSVGAHYRESIRSRSVAEYISKLEGGLQELEETIYWIELALEAGQLQSKTCANLIDEADDLMAILVACVKKVKEKRQTR
jgi:four helix bundle protein